MVCVFGVFFAADMTAFLREIWRLVRPGGVVAVTTWGPGLFEPANSHFWRCVGEVEPLPKTSSVQLMPHVGTHEALHRAGRVVVY